MIGAALRATRTAIPAATAAPTSRYQGSSRRPSATGAGSLVAGDAGLIASRGRAEDPTGRDRSRRPLLRGSERGVVATAVRAGATGSAVLRDSCTRRGGRAGRSCVDTSTGAVRSSSGRTRRTATREKLGARGGAVETRGATGRCGASSATRSRHALGRRRRHGRRHGLDAPRPAGPSSATAGTGGGSDDGAGSGDGRAPDEQAAAGPGRRTRSAPRRHGCRGGRVGRS